MYKDNGAWFGAGRFEKRRIMRVGDDVLLLLSLPWPLLSGMYDFGSGQRRLFVVVPPDSAKKKI